MAISVTIMARVGQACAASRSIEGSSVPDSINSAMFCSLILKTLSEMATQEEAPMHSGLIIVRR